MTSTMKVDTPEAMRALAHPLRLKILQQLEDDGHGRAADLAQALGEPANAISFHLRTLARAGLVVEAPEHARDKRDRVWRNAADNYQLVSGTPGMEALKAGYVEWFRRLITGDKEPGDGLTRESRTFVEVALTADEASRLLAEVEAVVERWTDDAREAHRANPRDPARAKYNVAVAIGPSDAQLWGA